MIYRPPPLIAFDLAYRDLPSLCRCCNRYQSPLVESGMSMERESFMQAKITATSLMHEVWTKFEIN
jgi:hypothetical protein